MNLANLSGKEGEGWARLCAGDFPMYLGSRKCALASQRHHSFIWKWKQPYLLRLMDYLE